MTPLSDTFSAKPKLEDPAPIKKEEDVVLFKQPTPKFEPLSKPPRPKSSPHSSVTNSPAISGRSPSISKRSPAPKPRHPNSVRILTAVAEECLGKARSAVHDVAMSLQDSQVEEYRKLIATGLVCLEAALQSGKLSPREEARMRLRYAATVQEETEDLMEAETALSKGISLCDQVRLLLFLLYDPFG